MQQLSVNGKSLARLAAVQMLFQYELRGRWQPFSKLSEAFVEYYSTPKDAFAQTKAKLNLALFDLLVSTLREKEFELRGIFSRLLPEDEDTLKLSILKVGLAELKWVHQAPSKVIVSEYSNIASALCVNPSIINSILDRFAKSSLEEPQL